MRHAAQRGEEAEERRRSLWCANLRRGGRAEPVMRHAIQRRGWEQEESFLIFVIFFFFWGRRKGGRGRVSFELQAVRAREERHAVDRRGEEEL